ncbi:unnamed protein product [Ectocarpus fasciculatus]
MLKPIYLIWDELTTKKMFLYTYEKLHLGNKSKNPCVGAAIPLNKAKTRETERNNQRRRERRKTIEYRVLVQNMAMIAWKTGTAWWRMKEGSLKTQPTQASLAVSRHATF